MNSPVRGFLLATFLALVANQQVWCATLFVAPTGGGDGSSWGTPLASIQSAIDSATEGDQIWIAEGVYTENLEMATGIELYGGFEGTETELGQRNWHMHRTILEGGDESPPTIYGNHTEGIRVDGFVVQHFDYIGIRFENVESATVANCTIRDCNFGGMSCSYASPFVVDSTFTENYKHGFYAEFGTPHLLRCRMTKNIGSDGAGLRVYAAPALIEECTMSGNSSEDGGGCTLASTQATMIRCSVTENFAEFAGGVQMTGPGSTLIECTIARNTGYTGAGVFSKNSTTAALKRCLIVDNNAYYGGGAIEVRGGTLLIEHCTVAGNRANRGHPGFVGFGLFSARNSIFWDLGSEYSDADFFAQIDHCCFQGGQFGEGNISGYPGFQDPAAGNWRLMDFSPCIDAGTETGEAFNGSAPDLGAFESPPSFSQGPNDLTPKTLYVNQAASPGGDGLSWSGALRTIREALLKAISGDEVWVAEGTYFETVPLKSDLSLYGGFGGFEGTLSQRDLDSHETVLDATGMGDLAPVVTGAFLENTVFDGFSVTHGYSRTPSRDGGGGLHLWKSNSLQVKNCRFFENQGENGGAIRIDESNVTIEVCDLSKNHARTGGGIYLESSDVTLMNTLITRNVSSMDYAVGSLNRSHVKFTNCTIANNSSLDKRGFLFSYANPEMRNSIYWGNGNGDMVTESTLTVKYSLFQGGMPGTGNLDEDPKFVDTAGSDFHLQPDSPCIDAGDPDSLYNDICRPPGQGTERNDMGAYGGLHNCQFPGSLSPTPTATTVPFDPSDINSDETVNAIDLLRLLKAWQSEIESSSPEDLFDDDILDWKDLNLFQLHWHEVSGP